MSRMVSRILAIFFLFASTAFGEVVRIEVESRSDLAEGKVFGLAGPYEKLAACRTST